MGISKRDTAVAVGVGLLLLGGKKALATTMTTPEHPLTPKPHTDDAHTDGAKLVARATQNPAMQWVTVFADLGVSPLQAAALARWAGIESSGNAHAVSKLGERGLMQAGPQSVEEGALTPSEWASLLASSTSAHDQAVLAKKYVDWLWHRASKFIAQPPVDPIDEIFYAKLYHQWPVDVRDGHLHGAAADMSRELADRWAGDPARMHRLRAANVIAWGEPVV